MKKILMPQNDMDSTILLESQSDDGCSCDNQCWCNDWEPSINCGCDYNEATGGK